MAIARFVNTEEIVKIWNEVNPTNPIGRDKARAWRDEWLAQWKKDHPEIRLPAQKVIPYIYGWKSILAKICIETKKKRMLNSLDKGIQ